MPSTQAEREEDKVGVLFLDCWIKVQYFVTLLDVASEHDEPSRSEDREKHGFRPRSLVDFIGQHRRVGYKKRSMERVSLLADEMKYAVI